MSDLLVSKKVRNKDNIFDNNGCIKDCLGGPPMDIFELESEIETIMNSNDNVNEYKKFDINNIIAAKKCVNSDEKVEISLNDDININDILSILNEFNIDSSKFAKIMKNGSIVMKNILDNHIKSLKQKYKKLDDNIPDHRYKKTSFGYLFNTTNVAALQCDTNSYNAKCRIHMDLDYKNIVTDDELFKTKFKWELSSKVFGCDPNRIKLISVKEGSVIVVITGLTLITLATLGLVTVSIKLANQLRSPKVNDKSKSKSLIKNEHKTLIKNEYKSDLSIIVNNRVDTNETEDIKMFNDDNETKSDIKNNIKSNDDCKVNKKQKSFLGNIFKKMFNNKSRHQSIIIDKDAHISNENIIVNIGEHLWVKKNNILYLTKVIGLTTTKVTVKFTNGGPYMFKSQETFYLNDPCLIQKEPGMEIDLEGTIVINKKNSESYVRIWKTGLNRTQIDC